MMIQSCGLTTLVALMAAHRVMADANGFCPAHAGWMADAPISGWDAADQEEADDFSCSRTS